MYNKMGSEPWSVVTSINTTRTLIFGFDVSHNKRKKSAAAMVSMTGKYLD